MEAIGGRSVKAATQIIADPCAILAIEVSTQNQITDLTRKLRKAEMRLEKERRRAAKAERRLAKKTKGSNTILEYRERSPSTSLLAETFLPEGPVPSPAQALQGQMNSRARWSLLSEFGAYDSEEIASNRSRAKNRHALASRWRREGRIFSVPHRGKRLFPGFQFDPDTGEPLKTISLVLKSLPKEEMSDWEVALWWTAANGWLDGQRPADLLIDDPDAVVAAARRLAEPTAL